VYGHPQNLQQQQQQRRRRHNRLLHLLRFQSLHLAVEVSQSSQPWLLGWHQPQGLVGQQQQEQQQQEQGWVFGVVGQL
jgi:hypothetical protein